MEAGYSYRAAFLDLSQRFTDWKESNLIVSFGTAIRALKCSYFMQRTVNMVLIDSSLLARNSIPLQCQLDSSLICLSLLQFYIIYLKREYRKV